jgi:large subunit ribosomal protein L21
MASYAIISLGGKQYRVSEGQKLLVDRLPYDERKTFHPRVLLTGGDGVAEITPTGVEVTARVIEHVLGEKIRIGKYRPKTGYRRHAGHRSRLSRIEIEAIGKRAARTKTAGGEPVAEKPPRTRSQKPAPTAETAPPRARRSTPKAKETE